MAQTPHTVVVHPLVLLSVVDHFNRIAREARVVGILLGESYRGKIEVTNSYAVPFEEDARDPSIWFLDHNYHENMFGMFKKVNAKERVVGWYSTGPKIRESDIAINELIRKYTSNPVLVIIDVKPKEIGLPTEAYVAVEEVSTDGSETHMSFRNIASEIGAQEAEEVGVEHLLRDIKDARVSTLAGEVSGKLSSLKGLAQRIGEIEVYLADVHAGKLPTNHAVLSALQDMFNLMPNLRDPALARAFAVKTNDMHLSVYIASIIRGIIALHDLINNKLANKEREQKLAQEREKKENPATEAKKAEGEQKDEKEEKKEEEQKKQ